MIATLLAFATGIAGTIGASALAAGPIGLVLAWLGAKATKPAVEIAFVGIGLAVAVAGIAVVTLRVEHLKHAEAELAIVKDELAHERLGRAEIERMLGCDKRIAPERELGACLAAQRAEAASARVDELARERSIAAAEQLRADQEAAAAGQALSDATHAIDLAPLLDDGPVPKVLRDAWDRERARRGLK